MRTAYKVLAYLVAAEVAVQGMVMVWAIAGLGKWVNGGGVIRQVRPRKHRDRCHAIPRGSRHPGARINGMFVVPGFALVLLIVSFFTKVRGAIKWAPSCLGWWWCRSARLPGP